MDTAGEGTYALLLTRRLPPDLKLNLPEVLLDHAGRQRTRLRVEVNGTCFAVLLSPGPTLADGDLLADANAARLRVRAAAEPVMIVRTSDPCLLARAAWHLGNRHVAVEIESGGLSLQPDHVLESMLSGLGLAVARDLRPFRPEPGAYHGGHAHVLRNAPAAPRSDSPLERDSRYDR